MLDIGPKYSLLIDNLPDYAIFLLDDRGIIQSWNSGAELIKGWTREQIIGRHFSTLYLEDDRRKKLPEQHLDEARESGRFEEYGWRRRAAEGSFYAHAILIALYEKDEFAGFAKITRDITREYLLEKDLREEKERFRLAFENGPLAIAFVNLDAEIIDVNRKFVQMFGFVYSELMGRTIMSLTYKRDYQKDIRLSMRDFSNNDTRLEKRCVSKDGKLFWVCQHTAMVRNNEGEAQYAMIIFEDIDELKRAEEELRHTTSRHKSIVETANDGIYIVDVHTRNIVDVNISFCRMTGFNRVELLNMRHYDFIAHSKRDIDLHIQAALEEDTHFLGERHYIKKDGSTFSVEVSFSVFTTGKRIYLTVIARDISEKVERTQRLRELTHKVQQVREDERRSISDTLHDEFAQELVSTKYILYGLKNEIRKDDSGIKNNKAYFEKLDLCIHSLERAIRQTRSLISKLHPAILNLPLEELLAWQLADFEKKTSIQTTFQKKSLSWQPGLNEKTVIFRIVQEALTNILKHAQARKAEIVLAQTEDNITVIVGDDGVGIDKRRKDRTSLGLLSMEERANSIGGRFLVGRQTQGGTQIKLYIPRNERLQ